MAYVGTAAIGCPRCEATLIKLTRFEDFTNGGY